MATYYKPSGKSSAAGIPILLIGGILAAAVLGAVYSYASYFIPFIYIRVLLTAGLALGMGWTINQLVKIGKIRNPSTAMWGSVVLGIFATYFAWAFWFQANMGALFLNPMDIFSGQKLLGMTGVWGLGDWVPTGFTLYAFWAVEALIIVIGTFLASFNQVTEPFCEACAKWIETKKEIPNLMLSGLPADLVQSLESGSADEVLKLKKFDGDPSAKVALKDCPSCNVTHLMDLSIVRTVVDSDGKASEEVTFLIQNLVLDTPVYEKIEAHDWKTVGA